jgi:hypothetical protein
MCSMFRARFVSRGCVPVLAARRFRARSVESASAVALPGQRSTVYEDVRDRCTTLRVAVVGSAAARAARAFGTLKPCPTPVGWGAVAGPTTVDSGEGMCSVPPPHCPLNQRCALGSGAWGAGDPPHGRCLWAAY